MTQISAFLLILMVSTAATIGHAQVVPHIITFTGFLEPEEGEPFSGTGLFKFAIVDGITQPTATPHFVNNGPITGAVVTEGGSGYMAPPAVTVSDPTGSGADLSAVLAGGIVVNIVVNNGGANYTDPTIHIAPPSENSSWWSNDGTLGGEPATAVEVEVEQGLYTVTLGQDMTGLSPSVLNRPGLYLRQWFNDGQGDGFVQITQDIRITSVPYALVAATVPTGSIFASHIAPGAVRTEHLSLSGDSLGDVEVDDFLVKGDLSIGTDDPNDNDSILFNAGEDYLNWLDAFDTFLFSNDLGLAGNLYIGFNDDFNDDTIFFDSGSEYLRWDESAGQFVFSAPVSLPGQSGQFEDLFLGTSEGDKSIYFFEDGNATGEYLRWDDSRDNFVFSDSVEIDLGLLLSGALFMDNEPGNQTIHFYDNGNVSGQSIQWEDTLKRFEFSSSVRVDGNAILEGSLNLASPDNDESIYFTGNGFAPALAEYLRWNDTRSTFMFSDGLEIEDDLVIGNAEGDHSVFFYDSGSSFGESLSWDNQADQFELSDDLTITGDAISEGDVISFGDLWVAGDSEIKGTHRASKIKALIKFFQIDHPLDPTNKFLNHVSMESPDMKTFYDGVTTLGEKGFAIVNLPSYFEALNMDYRYQLTPIGGPGPNLHVSREIRGNQFEIAGGSPGLKVSWQVTGIRQDAFARDNRFSVEEDKPEDQRGTYLYPEGFTNQVRNP